MSQPAASISADETADVVVVGAGPAGSAAAAYLAAAGLDVLLLEKTHFPREKVCGGALTPRAVRELTTLGVPTPARDGWVKNKGLRIVGGGMRLQLDWPEVASFPPYGLVRTRGDLDDVLARNAVRSGARLLQGIDVTAPIRDAAGRVVGVEATQTSAAQEATGRPLTFAAPLVIAADGNASRLAAGSDQREEVPMGVAVCASYQSPRHDDDYLETWLGLRSTDGKGNDVRLPGHGWIFGVGDGTSNVGLGMLSPPAIPTIPTVPGSADYGDVLRRWVATMPAEWTLNEQTIQGPIREGMLPLGFNRRPHYADGLMLVGDAGGMVNPFNGEGIASALESARLAAEVAVQAFARGDDAGRERVLRSYPDVLTDALGGYFTMGRWFGRMIGKPEVTRLAVKYGLPRQTLMRFLLKMTANLGEAHGGRADDRLLATLSRITAAA